MNNRVKYGLKNVHYSKITESTSSTTGVTTTTYGTVKSWPGAVSLSLEATAEKSVFRADDGDYYTTYGEGGYEGDLESALIPDDIKTEILNYKKDDDGLLVEDSESFSTVTYIALMFEFQGDKHAIKHCLYKCSLSRPALASQTTGENGSIEPQTETLTITASPRADADHYIHTQTGDDTDPAKVAAFYTAVPVPTFTPPEPELEDDN